MHVSYQVPSYFHSGITRENHNVLSVGPTGVSQVAWNWRQSGQLDDWPCSAPGALVWRCLDSPNCNQIVPQTYCVNTNANQRRLARENGRPVFCNWKLNDKHEPFLNYRHRSETKHFNLLNNADVVNAAWKVSDFKSTYKLHSVICFGLYRLKP